MKKRFLFDTGDILHMTGLEKRRSVTQRVLPAVALVAMGAAVGAGAGLLFAPSAGRRLRQAMGDRIEQVGKRVKSELRKQGVFNAVGQR